METMIQADLIAIMQAVIALACVPLAARERKLLRRAGWTLMAIGYGIAAVSRLVFHTSVAVERTDMAFSRVVALLLIAAGFGVMTCGYFRREVAQ